MNFNELGLAQPLLQAIDGQGYTTPTPIQQETIPALIAGRDLVGCAQTGTGKTAAFALPILQRLLDPAPRTSGQRYPIRALILAPTRELAAQICESFWTYGKNLKLKTAVIYGGVSQQPQVASLRRGVDILIATPGRLVDLIQQGYVVLDHVQTLVLDEADRMMDMGFRPDLNRIVARLSKRRQTVLFSATITPNVQGLISSFLQSPVHVNVEPQAATTDLIDQRVCFVARADKPHVLVDMINQGNMTRSIVFCRTKHGADRLAKLLVREGIAASAIHGNKSQNARQRTLAQFKSGRIAVLVATDVAARGLDVEEVSCVFNYDLPEEAETYLHRIGRTGRAGASGKAVAFCEPSERRYFLAIQRLLKREIRVDKRIVTPAAIESKRVEVEHREPRPQNGDRKFKRFPAAELHATNRHAAGKSRNPQRRRTGDRPDVMETARGDAQNFKRNDRRNWSRSPAPTRRQK